ncbi:MAG: ABC transporter ATP-binding protein [Myxococcota bacterium]
MIDMRNLSKVYTNGLLETVVLRDLTVAVEPGEFLAVMGPSGSGKTTFLNIAGLLDSFQGGTYRLDGMDVSGLSDRALSKLRNQKLSFIFQGFNLLPDLNVFDNVDVPLQYRGMGRSERQKRVLEALARVDLASRVHHLPSQLSGGQQQRVAIARALVGRPQVLLADEPPGNLDSAMARRILELLEAINAQGTTIIMVTHDPHVAARASRTIHILDGRVIDTRASRSASLTRVRASRMSKVPHNQDLQEGG